MSNSATTQAQSESEIMLGAYSVYTSKIDASASEAFQEALHGFVGVSYSAVAVSQQIVNGTNYHFFCNTKLITQFPVNGCAIVSIYKPLEGKAHITRIQNI